MTELQAVVAAARGLRAAGTPFLVATVVRVRGSSYRRPGARLLIAGDRWITGCVSGGCLEGDLVRRGWWHTGAAAAAVVTYDSTADEDDAGWGEGFGCNGVVDVLLEKVDAKAGAACPAIDRLLDAGTRAAPCAVVTIFRSSVPDLPVGERLVLDADGAVVCSWDAATAEAGRVTRSLVAEGRRRLSQPMMTRAYAEAMTVAAGASEVEALVEIIVPPPSLFLCGGGRDAAPVATMARLLGWNVSLFEPRRREAIAERFRFAGAERVLTEVRELRQALAVAPRPIAVVMSHDYRIDSEALRVLLPSPATHIGVLGPRRRTEKMLAELARDGVPMPGDLWRRLFSPVGLALGAETSEEIALAIVAEAQAALAGETAGFLRSRSGPVHPLGMAESLSGGATREAAE